MDILGRTIHRPITHGRHRTVIIINGTFSEVPLCQKLRGCPRHEAGFSALAMAVFPRPLGVVKGLLIEGSSA